MSNKLWSYTRNTRGIIIIQTGFINQYGTIFIHMYSHRVFVPDWNLVTLIFYINVFTYFIYQTQWLNTFYRSFSSVVFICVYLLLVWESSTLTTVCEILMLCNIIRNVIIRIQHVNLGEYLCLQRGHILYLAYHLCIIMIYCQFLSRNLNATSLAETMTENFFRIFKSLYYKWGIVGTEVESYTENGYQQVSCLSIISTLFISTETMARKAICMKKASWFLFWHVFTRLSVLY